MTIHRSQGQNLDRTVVDLRQRVFSHGQLYVALSRARKISDIRLLALDGVCQGILKTTNVVYKEVL